MIKKFYLIFFILLLTALQACSPSAPGSNDLEPEIVQEPQSTPIVIEQEDSESTEPESPVVPQEEKIENPIEPLSVVNDFYAWYFDQTGDEIFNQRIYEEHSALSDIFKSDLGYLLDSFEDQSPTLVVEVLRADNVGGSDKSIGIDQ